MDVSKIHSILTAVLILSGALIMILSIFSTRRLIRILTDSRYRTTWRLLMVLMILFAFGYVFSFYISIVDRPEILALMTGIIFLFGALFVLFVVRLGRLTISDLIETSISKTNVENILSTIPEVMIVATSSKLVRRVNRAAITKSGYKAVELLGNNIDILFPDLLITPKECTDKIITIDERIRTKSGEMIPVSVSISTICDSQKHVLDYIILAKDISAHKRAEERLEYAASHDPLTGLPNRALLYEILNDALNPNCVSMNTNLGILFLDLDHFKEINDEHGHLIGDQLLTSAARRLESCVRKNDYVCRLGGDEFVVLLTDEIIQGKCKEIRTQNY